MKPPEHRKPYNSLGNGSAMRISPISWKCKNETTENLFALVENATVCTHNRPEGLKGAITTAAAIYFALKGKSKMEIKKYLEEFFDYKFDFSIDELRQKYKYDITCRGTVPVAIQCFFESNDFEHAVRLAVSVGGDTDTVAAICGSIAEAFYKAIPDYIIVETVKRLPNHLFEVVEEFSEKYKN